MAKPNPINRRRLAITGLGMISSIGPDVVTSCASLRAKFTRPAETEVSAVDQEAMDERPVIGHPVAGVTDGFQGVALYTRLGARALTDLLTYAGLSSQPPAFWQRTMMIICVSKARNDELELLDDLLANELPAKVMAATGLPLGLDQCTVLSFGHASVLLACHMAQTRIMPGSYERCLVLGIDSLLDVATIEWLDSAGRLKNAENAVGLVPGEAAAALLLEDPGVARDRGARVEGLVGAVVGGKEDDHFLSEHPVFGNAMAAAIMTTSAEMKRVSEVYLDLNGEERRAADWGHAAARLQHDLGYVPEHVILPATSLGDTGAASGAIAICAAVRSFVRGYAHTDEVLVCSSSEAGEVASGCVYQP